MPELPTGTVTLLFTDVAGSAEEIGRAGAVPGSYLASVLRSLGELAMARGDLTDARRRLDESLSREVGDDWASERTVASQATLAKLGNNDRRA